MWLLGEDLGIRDVFASDVVYTESWGPVYCGVESVAHWFREWSTRGRVLAWDIRRFFHAGDQTAVTWHFRCQMGDESPSGFEGVSVIRWAEDEKIATLTEYCCEPDQYDPYRDSCEPSFGSGAVGH